MSITVFQQSCECGGRCMFLQKANSIKGMKYLIAYKLDGVSIQL